MKEWVNGREEVTKATAREFIVLVRKVLTEKGMNLDLGYRNINRVMVANHIHEKHSAPDSAQLCEGELEFPQNQSAPRSHSTQGGERGKGYTADEDGTSEA